MASGRYALLGQVTITANSNDWIDIIRAGHAGDDVQIPAGTYADMRAVCTALQTALNADATIIADGDNAFTVSVGSTGLVTIANTNTNFEIEWKNGAHTATNCGELLGYANTDTAANKATHTSDYQHTIGWYSEHYPSFDSWDEPEIMGGDVFVSASGQVGRMTNPNTFNKRVLRWTRISKEYYHPDYATSTYLNRDFITFWRLIAAGLPFKLYTETDSFTLAGTYGLIKPSDRLPAKRHGPGVPYFTIEIEIQKDPA